MSQLSVSSAAERANTAALVALVAGVAGVVLFFIGGSLVSDVFWAIGAATALVAVIAGVVALRSMRGERGARKWQAIVGLALGALVVAWFVLYILLAAPGVVDD